MKSITDQNKTIEFHMREWVSPRADSRASIRLEHVSHERTICLGDSNQCLLLSHTRRSVDHFRRGRIERCPTIGHRKSPDHSVIWVRPQCKRFVSIFDTVTRIHGHSIDLRVYFRRAECHLGCLTPTTFRRARCERRSFLRSTNERRNYNKNIEQRAMYWAIFGSHFALN